jgi:hypothetical protein
MGKPAEFKIGCEKKTKDGQVMRPVVKFGKEITAELTFTTQFSENLKLRYSEFNNVTKMFAGGKPSYNYGFALEFTY